MKIINVVGARPNFMKMAPIIKELNRFSHIFKHLLIHTGQHYDLNMSKVFFDELGMPKPDIDLGVGSGSHAVQTAKIMVEFEKICHRERPDLVVVVGDVNSTLACTITAKKLGIEVAHVEAGLRSRDLSMPEEINRLCTDVLCDYLFTTDYIAGNNLRAEGIADDKIFFVGNVMIDTLRYHQDAASKLNLVHDLGLVKGEYATLTLHRPSNVDDPAILEGILSALDEISLNLPVVYPIHPRTRKMVEQFGFGHYFCSGKKVERVWVTEPLGYLEFLHLNMNARCIITDSGGLQEEATVLGVPCVTLRDNTERPITCEVGTNRIVGNKPAKIIEAVRLAPQGKIENSIPDKWDGRAAERIVRLLLERKLGSLQ